MHLSGSIFEIDMDVGGTIRLLREAQGLSQGELEKRSGMLRSYISRVEGGHTLPSLPSIEKFARALNVEPYQLLYEQNGHNGQPRPARVEHPQPSRSAARILEAYDALSAANRRFMRTLMVRLTGQ